MSIHAPAIVQRAGAYLPFEVIVSRSLCLALLGLLTVSLVVYVPPDLLGMGVCELNFLETLCVSKAFAS